ncbi:cytochrome c oxidase subunit I [Polyangium spumosum]|uniref:Cytochrome c oxidase subunit I n=1 Tax=Polyangium spumosum TaxID=889282 RepID=A0A6N7PQ23_9BACT|nr:cbb3-type cytochrome c oxidase subunit I [Polyangium spumosum]MRG92184.1 cytochrome c oxidase subunit I [Polyangium spumosum]
MSQATIDADARPDPLGVGAEHPDYLRADSGLRSWLLTKDHKRIALMYYVSVVLFLGLGGIFALVLRTELLTPEQTFIDANTYNQMFTLHGVTMVWLFLIPSIPTIFGNFVLPIMLGAKDLAFPRINLASYYVFLLSAIILLGAMLAGGADTGWTFYVPYSTTSPTAVTWMGIGIFVNGISSIMTAVNFIVSTHTLRAKGLNWHRMPLFVWALYGTSIIILFATPVLGMSLILVALDHSFGLGLFDPRYGGDPVLYQHLFWFYSHPAVYIMVLPTFGVISEIVCSFSHNPPASYRAIAYSSLGIAFVGFFTWGHHMFVAGLSEFDAGVFGALSMFVAIFSAIKVFTWVATLRGGSISFATPMLYFLWFLFLFVFGGMTGVAVATQSLDVHWHDTYFVVAHFHFIMVGGTLTGFLAAAHYWFPKMFGRLYDERVGLLTSVAVFIGFVFTFLPQFLLGNAGMPRRYFTYPERYQWLNVLSTGGAWLLGVGLLLALLNLIVALKWGKRAGPNPWGSRSFEWITASPPSKHNFEETPDIARSAYEYSLSEEVAHERAKAR